MNPLQQPEAEAEANQVGEQHLGVAQHREHLDRGDRESADGPPAHPRGHHGSEQPRSLERGLQKQAASQGLVPNRRQGEADQVCDQPPFEQSACLPLAGLHRAGQGPPTADHQPALPETPEQYEKRQGG